VSIGLTPASSAEGNAFELTATCTGADLSQATTVTYTITGTAANAGDISTPLTGTITIPAGETSASLSIATVEDAVFEPDESFTVTASNPVNGTIGTGTASGTILNDDVAPVAGSVAVSDLTITEGDAGTSIATFTLTRTGGTAAFTVEYATADGTAAAGTDYVAATGTASFAEGATTATVSVTINGDTVVEPNETFFLNLANATGGAAIADSSATGTITNDDAAPVAGSVSVSDISITEGNSGTKIVTFTLARTDGTAAFNVDFATADGTAKAGSDYVATSGKASFAENATTAGVSVTIKGDTVVEPNETFFLNLANATGGATIADGRAVGTIQNDDAAPVAGSVSVSDISITEGNSGTKIATFILTRSGGTSAFSVDYTTANGTASAGSDYIAACGKASFAAGATTASVSVTIKGDTVFEPNETFFLDLANATGGATIADGHAVGTILNDDAVPTPVVSIALAPASAEEGGSFVLTATRTGADLSAPTTISYTISGEAANVGDLAAPLTGKITIPAHAASATLSIATVEDTVFEPNESFTVTASNPVNGTIGTGTASGTIFNDDAAPGRNVITGTACSEVIRGTNGADAITALAGNDCVSGKGGDDCFIATVSDGCDSYDGGAGKDTVDYSALTIGITAKLFESGGVATGLVTGGQSGADTLIAIENITGTKAADQIAGNAQANVIEGGGGNDKLAGGAGADTFVFKVGFGRDVISDFAASGRQHDVVEISTSLFADWSHVEAALFDGAKGAVLHVDDTNSITFTGVTKAQIVANHVDDFRFV
jgi:hypothetical protein